MGAMDFYKRNPDKALAGMRGLPPDEYKAYGIILDLIYSMHNRVPDDDTYMAGWCGYNIRVWKRCKAALIEKEKIYIEDGLIQNVKANEVIEEAEKSSVKVSNANRIKGQKSGAVRRKNKGLAEPKANHRESEKEIDKEETTLSLLPDLVNELGGETFRAAKAVEMWNELVDWQIAGEKPGTDPPRIPKVQNLNPTRVASVELRCREIGGLQGWARLLAIIKQSPHLLGQNDRGWTVTFDWVLNPKNLTKIMEGNYVRKSGHGKAGGTRDAIDWLHSEAERRESPQTGDEDDGSEPES